MRHAHHSSLSPSFLYSQHFLALWRCRCFCQNRWGSRKVHRNFHHGVQSQTAKCRVMVFKVKQHRERNLGTSTSATDLDKSEAFSCGNTRFILDAKEERDKSPGDFDSEVASFLPQQNESGRRSHDSRSAIRTFRHCARSPRRRRRTAQTSTSMPSRSQPEEK